jgi:glucose/arabinose dehydrogenase
VALAVGGTGTAAYDHAAASEGSQRPFRPVLVARGLHQPVDIAFAPGETGAFYVVERGGLIRRSSAGRLEEAPFLDVRSSISTAGTERGLLSLVFDPNYASNHLFYVQYVSRGGSIDVVRYATRNNRGDESTRSVLTRMPAQFLWPGGPQSLYHNGGGLVFGPDGALYSSVGDGGYWHASGRPCRSRVKCVLSPDPHGNAQNLSVLRGKLLRIDVSKQATPPHIVAYGLRNPWRYSFDRATGDMYIGDVGYERAEEVDVIPSSSLSRLSNFGWSVFEGRARRPGGPRRVNPRGTLRGPLYVYGHSHGDCTVVGGYVYRGSALPQMAGRYVFGDFCSGRVWSLATAGGRARAVRLEPLHIPALDSFGEDASGELYAVSYGGRVYALR